MVMVRERERESEGEKSEESCRREIEEVGDGGESVELKRNGAAFKPVEESVKLRSTLPSSIAPIDEAEEDLTNDGVG